MNLLDGHTVEVKRETGSWKTIVVTGRWKPRSLRERLRDGVKVFRGEDVRLELGMSEATWIAARLDSATKQASRELR